MSASVLIIALQSVAPCGEANVLDRLRGEMCACVCDAADWGEGDCEDWGLPMVAMTGGAR